MRIKMATRLEIDADFGYMRINGGIKLLGLYFEQRNSPIDNTIMLSEQQATELAKFIVNWINRSEEERKP